MVTENEQWIEDEHTKLRVAALEEYQELQKTLPPEEITTLTLLRIARVLERHGLIGWPVEGAGCNYRE